LAFYISHGLEKSFAFGDYEFMEVTLFAALLAGLVSFLSPCVLPLVPGYISMLSGIGVEQLRQGEQPRNSLMASAFAFVAGFSAVFISFGASASAVGHFLHQNRSLLAPIAGAVVLLFGLHLIGWLAKLPWKIGLVLALVLGAIGAAIYFRPGLMGDWLKPIHFYALAGIPLLGPWMSRWLNRDVHFRNLGTSDAKKTGRFAGVASGFLLGFAFAFGWTPCIGPILAAVLAMAATTENVARGVFLLAIYSAGLAIPFLLTAFGISRFLKFYQKFRKHLHTVEVASGFLLLFVGALIFANRLTWLSAKLSFLNYFSR
jgi:cytochrome c-type biogenesis protein